MREHSASIKDFGRRSIGPLVCWLVGPSVPQCFAPGELSPGWSFALVIMKSTTEEPRIKFFIAGISLFKGLLFRGFNVLQN
jgi:hypothetical protein